MIYLVILTSFVTAAVPGLLSRVLGVSDVARPSRRRRDDCDAANHELAASEARFRGLLEAAPDGIVVVDTSGRLILANSRIERLFGYRRDELIGQPVELLLPER
jgi:PAS domain-containing protein